MKNAKHVRQLMALCLALVLVVTLASSAMAASVTWTDSNGATYAAVVTSGSTTKDKIVPVTSAAVKHTQGTPTTVPKGDYSLTVTGDMTFPSAYSSKLTSAASQAGLSNRLSGYTSLNNLVSVSAGYPTGTYCYRTTVNCHTGTYRVDSVGEYKTTTLKSGSFSYAPYAFANTQNGIYCISAETTSLGDIEK